MVEERATEDEVRATGGGEMTATEELRRILDELGVKWSVGFYPDPGFTRWDSNGVAWNACDVGDGILLNSNGPITPEDVIAATVGEGTCHNDSEYPSSFFVCSECGCAHKRNRAYVDMPNFCPNCGRRIEVDK